ncbi:hypothetical protein EVA_14988 [gut metagenome]|uniref:Uncharacterized protein n=1 Tax=gut metagenome TaxID=749906 RepID=J9FPM8_9ZZZZ
MGAALLWRYHLRLHFKSCLRQQITSFIFKGLLHGSPFLLRKNSSCKKFESRVICAIMLR